MKKPENFVKPPANQKHSDQGVRKKWNRCLELLKERVSSQGYRTWLLPIIPVNHIDEKLILRVPSQFFFEWVEGNFREPIREAVKKVFGMRTQIEYLVASKPDHQPARFNLNEDRKNQPDEQPVLDETNHATRLDSRYQFENFFVVNDNELAIRAAQIVAKSPGKTDYNPLLIYGENGCGKTHLLNAAGNYITVHRKRKRILYMSGENFLNEYIYALQNRKLELYNKNFQQIDVLLLDDIQYLSSKKKSQEGLFYLLSEMERQRKQIIISANNPPAALVGFEDRLISFFQKGLIVDLNPPSTDTRLKWIDSYCEKNDLTILPEVRDFLGNSLHDGLHEIRAVMVRIAAQSSLLGKPVSLNSTKRLLSQIDAKWAKRNGKLRPVHPLRIEEIIKTVSEYMHVPFDVLISYSRQREVTLARQIAIYLCKEHSGEPLQVIAYHFKDRHYTAIIHNYKKITAEMKNNPGLHHVICEIQKKLSKSR